MIKVSVIIPVHNMAKYVRECVESILAQSLREIEVICVDDGSTDRSLKVLRELAKEDRRVRVLALKHQGVANARNKGIKAARGEFLAFCDADDWYPNEKSLEKLYKAAVKHKVVCVGGSFGEYRESDGTMVDDYKGRGSHFEGYTFYKVGIMKFKNWQMDFGWIRFIYQRQFIVENDFWFPNLTQHEDPVWFVQVMMKAEKFYTIPEVVYRYRTGHKDAMALSQERVNDGIDGVVENLLVAREHNLPLLWQWSVEQLEYYIKASPKVRGRLAELQKENERLRAELARAVEQKDREIEAIKKSRAWQVGMMVTKPVRGAKKIINKLR